MQFGTVAVDLVKRGVMKKIHCYDMRILGRFVKFQVYCRIVFTVRLA